MNQKTVSFFELFVFCVMLWCFRSRFKGFQYNKRQTWPHLQHHTTVITFRMRRADGSQRGQWSGQREFLRSNHRLVGAFKLRINLHSNSQLLATPCSLMNITHALKLIHVYLRFSSQNTLFWTCKFVMRYNHGQSLYSLNTTFTGLTQMLRDSCFLMKPDVNVAERRIDTKTFVVWCHLTAVTAPNKNATARNEAEC